MDEFCPQGIARPIILLIFIQVFASAPSYGGIAASADASDRWLAAFDRDADGFTKFPIRDPVIVGDLPGDVPTFSAAQRRCEQQHTHCILFRRGRIYDRQIDDNIAESGDSPDEPFVIGSTSDLQNPRPILRRGFGVGSAKKPPLRNLVIFGLDFYDPGHDPASPGFDPRAKAPEAALRMAGAGVGNLWIEDLRVRYFQSGLELQQLSDRAFQTCIIRRCAIDHCYDMKFGLYALHIRDLLLDGCFFDHNGWMENVYPKNIFSHDVYLQTWPETDTSDPQTRVIDCIFARAASTGCQQRSGGLNEDNCYLGNPIAGFVADTPGSAFVRDVVMGCGFDLSIDKNNPRGWGLQSNCCPSCAFDDCIWTDKHDPLNGDGAAIQLLCIDRAKKTAVPTRFTASNLIVHNWSGKAVDVIGTPARMTFQNCDLPGFKGPGVIPTPKYLDPDRTLATYAHSLGYQNSDEFLAAAAKNRRGQYNAALTAPVINHYIRAGFQVAP